MEIAAIFLGWRTVAKDVTKEVTKLETKHLFLYNKSL